MNTTHLDKQAALRWHAGEPTEAERHHVAACSQCQAELAPLAEALQSFTLAAREWGESKAALAQEGREARAGASLEWRHSQSAAARQWRGMAIAWGTAGALLILLFGFALPRWQGRQATQQAVAHRLQAQQQITRDDALLEAIDQDVSQDVPTALTPLSQQ